MVDHLKLSNKFLKNDLEMYEEIGKGGFGVIHRGKIKSTGKIIAIKILDLEEETDFEGLLNEIKIISECRLNEIMEYYGTTVDKYNLWIITEYMNGGSLYDYLKYRSIDNEKTILYLLKKIMNGLRYLHERGIIHRDLKSQNILFNSCGEVKLADFGVSTQVLSKLSLKKTIVGTPYWMAPEIITQKTSGYDLKVDVWSLGCCGYEMFNGIPPLMLNFTPLKALSRIAGFTTEEELLKEIDILGMDVSRDFSDFLSNCLILDPQKRLSISKLLAHKFITEYQHSDEDQTIVKEMVHYKISMDKKFSNTKNTVLPNKSMEKKTQKTIDKSASNCYFDMSSFKFDSDFRQEDTQSSVLQSPCKTPYKTPYKTPFKQSSAFSKDSTKPHIFMKSNNYIENFYLCLPLKHLSTQSNFLTLLTLEFQKTLERVLSKLNLNVELSKENYEKLTLINLSLTSLVTYTSNQEKDHSKNKILIFHYLRYIIRDLTKSFDFNSKSKYLKSSENSEAFQIKSALQKLIIPSKLYTSQNDNTNSSSLEKNKYFSRHLTKIESRLFDSWIDRMFKKWK